MRSFFAFVAAEELSLADHCHRICAIPLKHAPVRSICYLEQDEMQTLLASPDRSTPQAGAIEEPSVVTLRGDRLGRDR